MKNIRKKHSVFISKAVGPRLKRPEEQLKQALIKGYQERREESAEINREWERATLESLEDEEA